MTDVLFCVHVLVKNLNFGNFTLSFARLRQRIVLKCVLHVHHDYFPSFNGSNHRLWRRRCRCCSPCLSAPYCRNLYLAKPKYVWKKLQISQFEFQLKFVHVQFLKRNCWTFSRISVKSWHISVLKPICSLPGFFNMFFLLLLLFLPHLSRSSWSDDCLTIIQPIPLRLHSF